MYSRNLGRFVQANERLRTKCDSKYVAAIVWIGALSKPFDACAVCAGIAYDYQRNAYRTSLPNYDVHTHTYIANFASMRVYFWIDFSELRVATLSPHTCEHWISCLNRPLSARLRHVLRWVCVLSRWTAECHTRKWFASPLTTRFQDHIETQNR